MMSQTYYNVRPRYAGGSPAQVDAQTARRVANDERQGHAMALTGIYGSEAAAAASIDRCRRISEEVLERSDCWLVRDLITDEHFIRPFPGNEPSYVSMAQERRFKHQQAQRFQRLKTKYHLPLEIELPE